MKRDMDLVRQILLAVEARADDHGDEAIAVEGYSQEQVGYHVTLLVEAGLLKATNVTSFGSKGEEWLVERLTWAGHEFLESAKDDGVWSQAKTILGGVGGFTFGVAQAVLTDLVKKKLGLS